LYVYPRFNDARDPTAGGAENRTAHLLDEASEVHDLSLLQAKPDPSVNVERPYENKYFKPLTPAFLTDLNPSYWIALYRALQEKEYDIVQVESLGGIIIALILTTILQSGSSVIYGSHNVEAERVQSALNPNLPFYKRLGAPIIIPALERIAVRYADYIIAVSNHDKKLFCEMYDVPVSKVFTVRSGTTPADLDQLDERQEVRSRHNLGEEDIALVFHGTYENYANREALEAIRERIMPGLQAKTSVSVFIAGNGMPSFENDRIMSVGFVSDLDSFLHAMDIAIVPLSSGAGTKLKVFDYMSVGLPIVTTKKGVEGIDITEGTDAIVVEDVDSEFITAIEELIENPSWRQTLGDQARILAETEYSWDTIGGELRDIYAQIIADLEN
jgi:glycosyltransferase involved in cell wall biosynthesis